MLTHRFRMMTIVFGAVLAVSAAAFAQFGVGAFGDAYQPLPNVPYDGRFTFVRVRYHPAPGGFWPGRRPSWIHGYPLAKRNLMQIMNEVSLLGGHNEIDSASYQVRNR